MLRNSQATFAPEGTFGPNRAGLDVHLAVPQTKEATGVLTTATDRFRLGLMWTNHLGGGYVVTGVSNVRQLLDFLAEYSDYMGVEFAWAGEWMPTDATN